jgi:hypothetical protein
VGNAPNTADPLCVRIDFRRGRAWGWLSVKVGTVGAGIGGVPELLSCVVAAGETPPQGLFRSSHHLSDLPTMLDTAAHAFHGLIEILALYPKTETAAIDRDRRSTRTIVGLVSIVGSDLGAA